MFFYLIFVCFGIVSRPCDYIIACPIFLYNRQKNAVVIICDKRGGMYNSSTKHRECTNFVRRDCGLF